VSPLPTSKTAVVTDPNRVRFYIYGAPGVGKTTLASQFRRQNPDGTWAEPLFLCTEEGVGFLEVLKVPVPDWGTFKNTLKELTAADPEATRYSTVVVDTIDLLFTMCEKFVCEAKSISHPSELEWGKGWAALRDEFQIVLSYLSRMKQGLVLIGHAKVWEKKERSTMITCVQPTLGSTGRRVVLPIVDVILYCETIEVVDPKTGTTINKRIMRSEPNETVEAKDRTSRLPATMPMEYAKLAAYISGAEKKS
jgi:hypothetical protein